MSQAHNPNSGGPAPASLAEYIETGNTAQVRNVLKGEVRFDVNARWPRGHTPLELASAQAHLDIIEALVQHKANVNTTNHKKETPLFFCVYAKLNAPEAVKYLLSVKAEPNHQRADGWSPLCMAAFAGNVPIIHSLLQYKADPEKTISSGASPVWLAAQEDHAEAVRTLATANADLNKVDHEGVSPLWKASKSGHKNAVEVLLILKADPNVHAGLAAPPICMAASGGHIEVVKKLVQAKADVNGPPGLNPLYLACRANNTGLVRFLIESGANPTNVASLRHPKTNFTPEVNDLLLRATGQQPPARDSDAIQPLIRGASEKTPDVSLEGLSIEELTTKLEEAKTQHTSAEEKVEELADKVVTGKGKDKHNRDLAQASRDEIEAKRLVKAIENALIKAKTDPQLAASLAGIPLAKPEPLALQGTPTVPTPTVANVTAAVLAATPAAEPTVKPLHTTTEQQLEEDRILLEKMVAALRLLRENFTLSNDLEERNDKLTISVGSIESSNKQGTLQILADQILGQIQAEISRVESILYPASTVQQIQLLTLPDDVLVQYIRVFENVAKAKGLLLKKPEEMGQADLKAYKAELLQKVGGFQVHAGISQGPLLDLCNETTKSLEDKVKIVKKNLSQSQNLSGSQHTLLPAPANGQSPVVPAVKPVASLSII
jgi:ankyrin repeat protein